ncbi:hypothetical protein BpHYR1_051324 [Brachionus plicatilis]|uniref:Uncharacterized protein n=1 Tax=Brachionus plicatilis TaxID=10195 RepID=A0A3M7PRR6_BRAPC|nr:hypothetical protein BpHYR1_051324 [Brachionus plicatilis]
MMQRGPLYQRELAIFLLYQKRLESIIGKQNKFKIQFLKIFSFNFKKLFRNNNTLYSFNMHYFSHQPNFRFFFEITLSRNLRLNARFPFQTRKANKAAYDNSFLQKFLRKLRNDSNSQNARASLYLQFTICLTILTLSFNNNYCTIRFNSQINNFVINKTFETQLKKVKNGIFVITQFFEIFRKITEIYSQILSQVKSMIK